MSGIIYSYHISMNLEFSGQIVGKYTEIRNFTKIRPVETRLFRADGRTDGQTAMKELIVAFRNFANASTNNNRN